MSEPTERWFLVYRGELYSETETYETRDAALDAVASHNASEPGFTCLRVPYHIVACEGCGGILLDCIFDVGAQHLTQITWQDCPTHEETRYHNEQTPLIASWVYDRGEY